MRLPSQLLSGRHRQVHFVQQTARAPRLRKVTFPPSASISPPVGSHRVVGASSRHSTVRHTPPTRAQSVCEHSLPKLSAELPVLSFFDASPLGRRGGASGSRQFNRVVFSFVGPVYLRHTQRRSRKLQTPVHKGVRHTVYRHVCVAVAAGAAPLALRRQHWRTHGCAQPRRARSYAQGCAGDRMEQSPA